MTKRIILFLLGFVLLGSIHAKEVNKETASVTAVKALHKFAAGFSGNVQSVSPVMYQGTKAYYVVNFAPQGWVLVAAEHGRKGYII